MYPSTSRSRWARWARRWALPADTSPVRARFIEYLVNRARTFIFPPRPCPPPPPPRRAAVQLVQSAEGQTALRPFMVPRRTNKKRTRQNGWPTAQHSQRHHPAHDRRGRRKRSPPLHRACAKPAFSSQPSATPPSLAARRASASPSPPRTSPKTLIKLLAALSTLSPKSQTAPLRHA